MKIYISADIEGVTGCTCWDEASSSKPNYPMFANQMTNEVKAACEGAIKAGADDILVKDAHATARNIDPNMLPSNTRLARAWSGHPFLMMQELDNTFDAAIMIGYHSFAGSGGNPLAHTLDSGSINYIKINNEYASEFVINAYTASLAGVPVVFISGDGAICRHAAKFNPAIGTVEVKQGVGNSVVSIHPKLAQERIEAGVEEAIRNASGTGIIPLPKSFKVEISYIHHYTAYKASFYPGMKQISPNTLIYESNDYFDVLRMMMFVI